MDNTAFKIKWEPTGHTTGKIIFTGETDYLKSQKWFDEWKDWFGDDYLNATNEENNGITTVTIHTHAQKIIDYVRVHKLVDQGIDNQQYN